MSNGHKTDPKAERQIHVELGRPDTSDLRPVAGSGKDTLNRSLIAQAAAAQWTPRGATDAQHGEAALSALLLMMEIAPRDGVEGALAAQFVAQHGMSMEMVRKAHLPDQPHEIAAGMRKASIQASRACVEILDALDRRRGKRGRQNIRVTHLHVSDDALAVIGNFEAGGGDGEELEDGPREPPARLAHDAAVGAVLPPLLREEPARHSVPGSSDARQTAVQAARRERKRP